MIKLADGHVIEIFPAVHAIVGHIIAAVGAQQHVPAIARIDPQRMLIGVKSAVIGLECLAAVAGAIQTDAEDVDIFLVAGIDADLAEVHGPRIDAVDARPRFAAVGGFIQSAVLEAVRPLLILHVLALSAVPETIGPLRIRRSRRPRRATVKLSSLLSLPRSISPSPCRRDYGAEQFDQLPKVLHIRLVDLLDDIADAEARPFPTSPCRR